MPFILCFDLFYVTLHTVFLTEQTKDTLMKKFFSTLFLAFIANLCVSAQTSLGMTIHFKTDSVNIQESQYAMMEMMAQYFKSHPKELFFIGGFTADTTPKDKIDFICEQRAQAVRNMLIEKYGVDGTYIIAVGVGVSTKSEEREFNEKVEFFKK